MSNLYSLETGNHRLERAILCTLAYADVFDFPLTLDEIHRYLIEQRANLQTVQQILLDKLVPARKVIHSEVYYMLPGRANTAARRQQRLQTARQLWPAAIRFGRVIARLPFIRMVAITGALALNNIEAGADIDYLIVTKPGRLWISRALTIAVTRFAAAFRVRLCPNYLVSENALCFTGASLYTAHELVQMIPLTGLDYYDKIRTLNDWTDHFLPNARGAPTQDLISLYNRPESLSPSPIEHFLRYPIFDRLENWEMQRKIRKFQNQTPLQSESEFGREWCKGHFHNHGLHTSQAYHQRLAAFNLVSETPP